MMKMFLFILLAIGCVGLNKSYADEQVKCIGGQPESEVLKLLSLVKNKVLGTVPRFCRENTFSQLTEQFDSGEEELSEFIKVLRVVDPKEKNITQLKKDELELAVNQTAKFIILKKMWEQTGESDKYELLLSTECAPIGLNRFPTYKVKKGFESSKKMSSKSLDKIKKVCDSESIQDLAPHLTKDILAETLLNLRKIFPEHFPEMVNSLCEGIKQTDEALLKDNQYKDFLNEDHSLSAGKFSVWLKELYEKHEEMANANASIISMDVSLVTKDIKKDFDSQQKTLKSIYESNGDFSNYKNDASVKTIVWLLKNGAKVEKNTKGFFILKATDKVKKEEDQEANKLVSKLEVGLKTSHEYVLGKGNTGEGESLYKDFPFTIFQDESGGFRYKINAKARADILERAKLNLKKLLAEDEEFFHDPGVQEINKFKFELQESLEGQDYLNTNILKNKEGYFQEVLEEEIKVKKEFAKLSAQNPGDIVLSPWDFKSYYVNLDGKIIKVYYNHETYEDEKKIEIAQRKQQGPMLKKALQETYQNTSSDYKKIENLPYEKKKALIDYTGIGYRMLNTCLRNDSCRDLQKEEAGEIVELLKAVKTSDEGSRILYRGARFFPEDQLLSLKNNPKNFILDKGFLSTSADLETAKKFSGEAFSGKSGTLFIIKSSNCIGISKLSNAPQEDEFLCPPGMKFDVKRQDPNKNIYILEEVK